MQLKGLLTEQPCICPEKIVHTYDLALAGPEAGETLVAFSSSGLFWMSRKGTFPRISALLAPVWVRTSGAGSLSAQHSGQGKTSPGTQPCSAASAWTWAGLRFTEPLFPTSHDKNSQSVAWYQENHCPFTTYKNLWLLICVQPHIPSDLRKTLNSGEQNLRMYSSPLTYFGPCILYFWFYIR